MATRLNNPLKRPVVRDTTVSSGRDILCRLLFAIHIASLVAGLLLLLYGATRHIGSYIVSGTVLLALTAVLIPVRRRWFASDPRSAPPPSASKNQLHPSAARPMPGPGDAPTTGRRPRILLLNASLGGAAGNTASALDHLAAHLAPHADLARVTLAANPSFEKLPPLVEASDAFVIGTGTHWDSWSSHLQAFLEAATPFEGMPALLGKPAACVVTEHSVGGKAVLSRLQGVLVTLGCAIPPMSGLVLSRAAHASTEAATAEDCWCVNDLAVVAHNLLAATAGRRDWHTWPVDRAHFTDHWLPPPSSAPPSAQGN